MNALKLYVQGDKIRTAPYGPRAGTYDFVQNSSPETAHTAPGCMMWLEHYQQRLFIIYILCRSKTGHCLNSQTPGVSKFKWTIFKQTLVTDIFFTFLMKVSLESHWTSLVMPQSHHTTRPVRAVLGLLWTKIAHLIRGMYVIHASYAYRPRSGYTAGDRRGCTGPVRPYTLPGGFFGCVKQLACK